MGNKTMGQAGGRNRSKSTLAAWNVLFSLLFAVLTLGGWAQAQLPEDAGPHPVGVRSVSFSHALAANSTVTADIFYPALVAGQNTAPNTSDGPYPLVAFLHGYFAPPSFYSELTEHIASYGFVVAAVGTESGFFQNIQNEAHDAQAMLHWVDEQGANAGSFLYQLPSSGSWSAVGHSNGAAAIFHALGWESRIRYVVSTEGNWFQIPSISAFDGSFLSIGSSQDLLAPPNSNARRYFTDAVSCRRRVYTQIQGGGHNGSLDFASSVESLPHSEQRRLHRRLITGFLRAEILRDENLYTHLIGNGAASEPLTREAICPKPVLWLDHDGGQPGTLSAALAGVPGDSALLTWTRRPDLQAMGLDVPGTSGFAFHTAQVGANGIEETSVPLSPAFSGETLSVQGLRLAGPSWAYTCRSLISVP